MAQRQENPAMALMIVGGLVLLAILVGIAIAKLVWDYRSRRSRRRLVHRLEESEDVWAHPAASDQNRDLEAGIELQPSVPTRLSTPRRPRSWSLPFLHDQSRSQSSCSQSLDHLDLAYWERGLANAHRLGSHHETSFTSRVGRSELRHGDVRIAVPRPHYHPDRRGW